MATLPTHLHKLLNEAAARSGADPILVHIATHDATLRAYRDGVDDGANDAERQALDAMQLAARDALQKARPTTLAGLMALADHLWADFEYRSRGDPGRAEDEEDFAALLEAIRGLKTAA